MTQAHLDEIAKAARNAYIRERRRANPERTKADQKRYWERRALRELAQKSSEVKP